MVLRYDSAASCLGLFKREGELRMFLGGRENEAEKKRGTHTSVAPVWFWVAPAAVLLSTRQARVGHVRTAVHG